MRKRCHIVAILTICSCCNDLAPLHGHDKCLGADSVIQPLSSMSPALAFMHLLAG